MGGILLIECYVEQENGKDIQYVIVERGSFLVKIYDFDAYSSVTGRPKIGSWKFYYNSLLYWKFYESLIKKDLIKNKTIMIPTKTFFHWVLTGLFDQHIFAEIQVNGEWIRELGY
jgi:hypothetical protein